jgi:alpha-L-arabinofuranosidase
VPVVDVAATHAFDGAAASVSIVNRDPSAAVELTIAISDAAFDVVHAHTITGNPKATNDWDTPDLIRPVEITVRSDEAKISVSLPGPSHTVISLQSRGASAKP